MSSYKVNYVRGLLTEAIVGLLLERRGGVITPSTPEENIQYDIDFYHNNETISIKCQDRGVETGNFSFELEQQLGLPHLELPGQVGEWVTHQGYHKSRADVYAIVQGDHLYVFDAAVLHKHVKRHGWDRVCTLSEQLKETQVGRQYTDARNGLVAREKIQPKEVITVNSVLLEVRDSLVKACLKQYIDYEVLRDTRLMMATINLLQHAFECQPNSLARQNLTGYVIQGLTLVGN